MALAGEICKEPIRKTMEKILVINPVPLFPTKAMNQVRTLNMIKSLKTAFHVDVLTPYTSKASYKQLVDLHNNIGVHFIGIKSQKSSDNIVKKRINQLCDKALCLLLGKDMDYINGMRYEKAIQGLIDDSNYDFVISNYWEFSGFFRKVKNKFSVKILDTHYAVQENIEIFKRNRYKNNLTFLKNRELRNSLKLECLVADKSDIIVSLSNKSEAIFRKLFPSKVHIMIPDGNDIEHFASKIGNPEPNTILFYGSMSSHQNQGAFFRLYNNILPLIKEIIPEMKLLVVGSNPPLSILQLNGFNGVHVTGYVEDVRDWLSKGMCMILPLEIGSGFRGRVIELMSMGIPVIGTHNALESIGMKSGIHGLISDNDKEMAEFAIKLLKDKKIRETISGNCLKFVREKYSLEATFDFFTKFLRNYQK